tara:strand:- start:194 stop:685 length:492 start_codon:yes stop_codon:yes gene_type:complete
MNHIAYISVGSNLKDRIHNCKNAIDQIGLFSKILLSSSFYETESWGYEDENLFINSVIKIETTLSPSQLLNNLQLIEQKYGRIKNINNNYEARIIDLDILFFDKIILNSNDLVIPHMHLYDRNFVLIPFNEIDPEFLCPSRKLKIFKLLQICQDKSKVYIYPH